MFLLQPRLMDMRVLVSVAVMGMLVGVLHVLVVVGGVRMIV
ncbi:MAG: hypothetical protein WKF83_01405 [Nocardioidaceae bacterium]